LRRFRRRHAAPSTRARWSLCASGRDGDDDDASAIPWPAFPRLRQLLLGRPRCPAEGRPCYNAGFFASVQLEVLSAYLVSGMVELLERRRMRLRLLDILGLGDIREDDAQSAFTCKTAEGDVGVYDRFYPGCTNSPTSDMVS
jgi:hypothetical protein